MEIIERPYNINFSINNIRYIFQLEDLQRPGLKLQIKLLVKPLGGTFTELYTFLLQPGLDGLIYLYLEEYINSTLQYVVPGFAFNQVVTNADKQACIFTIHYRELTDDNSQAPPDYITSEQMFYTLYAIKGGIEKHLHSRNNFFKFFEATKPFLTWQPGGRFVDTNQPLYLTFLNPNYGSEDLSLSFILCYRLTSTSGQVQEQQINLDQTGLVLHVNVSPFTALASQFAAEQLYKLEVGIIATGATVGYNYSFYFDQRPTYCFYDLVYFNSLGGVDFLRVKGTVAETVERTLQEGVAGLDVQAPFSSFKTPESFYPGITLQKKFKGDVGYLRAKQWQYSYLEILSSQCVFQRLGFRWVSVIALQKSQDLGSKKDTLNSFPIEWGLSELNEVYTPEASPLLMGDDSMFVPAFCANVSNLAAHYDGNEQTLYYSFQPVAGVPDYTVSILDSNNLPIYTKDIYLANTGPYASSIANSNIIINGTYTLKVITHCTTDSQSSGAILNFAAVIIPKVCPIVTSYKIQPNGSSPDNLTAVMVGVTFPTPENTAVKVNSIKVDLYKVGTTDAIGTATITSRIFSFYQWNNLQPGDYYAVLTTQCDIGSSQVITTGTITLTVPVHSNAAISNISNTGTPGSTRTEVFEIGSDMKAGDQFYLEVYSHKVIVTAVDGDTATSIATKLAAAVNATTAAQWNSSGSAPATGTPGFKPTATSSGARITVTLNYQNQFAASVIKI